MNVKKLLFALFFSSLTALYSAYSQGPSVNNGGLELHLACDKENYIWM